MLSPGTPGWLPALATGEPDRHVRLHRTAEMNRPRLGGDRPPHRDVGLDPFDGGPVEHHAEAAFFVVLQDQHDRSPEIGVDQQGRRHQKLPTEVSVHDAIVPQRRGFMPTAALSDLTFGFMRALVKHADEVGLRLDDVSIPEPGPDDILIRVLTTGICGTDLHIFNWDDWARATIPAPMTVGHEFSGEIVGTGPQRLRFRGGRAGGRRGSRGVQPLPQLPCRETPPVPGRPGHRGEPAREHSPTTC